MKKLLKKIKCWLKKLFGKNDCCKKKKPELTLVKTPTKPESTPTPEPKEEVDPERVEPDQSFPEQAKIQSFLWKPEGDHTNKPVVLIGCDALRSEDLSIEIYSAKGRKLKVGIRNTARANKMHEHKYGRIHFRIDRSGKDLVKNAPLTVVVKTGDRVLKKIKIQDPRKRLEQKSK